MTSNDVTIVLSCLSLLVALAAFVWNWLATRRGLLHQLHTSFIDAEHSAARRLLHSAFRSSPDDWHEHVSEDELVRINSAIAQLDGLAFQAERRYVSRSDAKTLWGRSMVLCRQNAECYVQHRRTDDPHLWRFLDKFIERGEPSRD